MDSIKISLDSFNILIRHQQELEKTKEITSYYDHIEYILLIVLISGIIGGITNFFFSNTEKSFTYNNELKNNGNFKWYELLKAIFTGWSAALVVPVLLQAISSNLLSTSRTEPTLYLIIAGFCILGAVYADRFLQSVYDRIIKLEAKTKESDKKVEEVKDIVSEIETKSQEPDIETDKNIIENKIDENNSNSNYSKEDINKIILAIKDSKYTFRLLKGISKDTDIDITKLENILNYLENIGICRSKISAKGNKLWTINN